jgi:Kef-type K+ transport system membrane component KefB
MESLAITLVIVFAGIVVLPNLARRLGMPVIVTEILYGMIIGKSLLNVVPDHPIIEFFSSFGLVYLMFLAGLETDFGKMTWRILKRVIAIVIISISIPFVSGYFLSYWLGTNPLLLGTILCTTSLGLILPLLKDLPFGKRLANMLLTSVVLVDIISLFILAFVLATLQGSIEVRFIYSFIGIIILFFIPWVINKRKLRRKITIRLFKKSVFDLEMRVAFAVIFILAAISSQLGFHAIVGAFIAGLLISEILPKATLQEERLQSFGYSFFIPLFFIFTGARVNIPAVFAGVSEIAVLFVILAVGILSKAVSVFVVTRLSGQNARRSAAFGLFHSARLSLIIAAADISIRLGFIKEELFAMLVILAVVSATASPALGKYILRNEVKK